MSEAPWPELNCVDLLDLQGARRELANLGFVRECVQERLGLGPGVGTAEYLFRLANLHLVLPPGGPDELDELLLLFVLGQIRPRERIEPLLSPEGLRALVGARLLELDGAGIRANGCLLPVYDLHVLCDPSERRGGREQVFFPDASTVGIAEHLDAFAPEARARAVDLGTGCGLLALLLAGRYGFGQVSGVDPNPRAIRFARFNAALNDLPVDFQVGRASDLAAGGGGLDLLTFVLPGLYSARYSEALGHLADEGEELLAEVYGLLDGVMAEDGRALLFHQARTTPGDDLLERLAGLPGAPKLSVLRIPGQGGAGYSFGASLIRRRGDADPALVTLQVDPSFDMSRESLEAHLRALTLLRGPQWLSARLSVAPWLTAQRVFQVERGALREQPLVMVGEVPAPPEVLGLLQRVDGHRTAGELLEGDAELLAPYLRTLVERGLLRLG